MLAVYTHLQTDLPTMTDSGGFQVFSLELLERGNKICSKCKKQKSSREIWPQCLHKELASEHGKLCVIDEEGVTFTSHLMEVCIALQPNVLRFSIISVLISSSHSMSAQVQLQTRNTRSKRWIARIVGLNEVFCPKGTSRRSKTGLVWCGSGRKAFGSPKN